MLIKSISVRNHNKGMKIEQFTLNKVNLLVGLSGAGKTQILKMIYTLKEIVLEETEDLHGFQWELHFDDYEWSGRFSSDMNGSFPKIEEEKLSCDGKEIFTREGNSVIYKGIKMPRVSENKSLLSIFTEEEDIKPAYEAIMQIHYINGAESKRMNVSASRVQRLKGNFSSLDELVDANLDVMEKLVLAYELQYDIFHEIKEDYIDIFHQVEDIRIDTDRNLDRCYVSIKENNTGWIEQNSISSGMLKTLMYIAEIKLLKSNSVVLIDEFENSLGFNCIQVVSDIIIINDRDMQFVITSHHPYIINNIDVNNWKVVVRQASTISIKTAKDMNLGKSRHELFKELINSKEFTEGIN